MEGLMSPISGVWKSLRMVSIYSWAQEMAISFNWVSKWRQLSEIMAKSAIPRFGL